MDGDVPQQGGPARVTDVGAGLVTGHADRHRVVAPSQGAVAGWFGGQRRARAPGPHRLHRCQVTGQLDPHDRVDRALGGGTQRDLLGHRSGLDMSAALDPNCGIPGRTVDVACDRHDHDGSRAVGGGHQRVGLHSGEGEHRLRQDPHVALVDPLRPVRPDLTVETGPCLGRRLQADEQVVEHRIAVHARPPS
jgi:hypothetical protein